MTNTTEDFSLANLIVSNELSYSEDGTIGAAEDLNSSELAAAVQHVIEQIDVPDALAALRQALALAIPAVLDEHRDKYRGDNQ